MNSKIRESIAVLGAVLPLLGALRNLASALMISVAVLFAVALFELIFIAIRRFWLRSLRLFFAIIVLSTILSAIWKISPYLGFRAIASYFPISLLSGIFLIQGSVGKTISFSARLKTWIGFFVLSVLIGYLAEHAIRNFIPGFFWLVGLIIIVLNRMSRRIFSYGS